MTDQNKLLASIRENWAVLLFLGSLIIGWTQTNYDNKSNRERIDKLEISQLSSQNDASTFKSDIVEIKTTLLFIKQQLSSQ